MGSNESEIELFIKKKGKRRRGRDKEHRNGRKNIENDRRIEKDATLKLLEG